MNLRGWFVLVLGALLGPRVGAQPVYEAIDLNAVYGNVGYISDINASNVMVGAHGPSVGNGFIIDSTGLHDLPTLPGGRDFRPLRINNLGHILGYGIPVGGSNYHSYLYRDGVFTDLNLNWSSTPAARDLNDSDVVVGGGSGVGYRAFKWENGQVTFLPYSGWRSGAYAINSFGVTVGQGVSTSTSNSNAVRWDPSGFMDLSPPTGSSDAIAYDINDSKVAVGDFGGRAAMWDGNGNMTMLPNFGGSGFLSRASGINNGGQIVGIAPDSTGRAYSCLWDGAALYDLEELSSPGNGFRFGASNMRINDNSWITVQGVNDTSISWFLLRPVPEPSGALPAIGVAWLLALRCRSASAKRTRRACRH